MITSICTVAVLVMNVKLLTRANQDSEYSKMNIQDSGHSYTTRDGKQLRFLASPPPYAIIQAGINKEYNCVPELFRVNDSELHHEELPALSVTWEIPSYVSGYNFSGISDWQTTGRQGAAVISNSTSLKLHSVTTGFSGQYSCTVHLGAERVTITMHVYVVEVPSPNFEYRTVIGAIFVAVLLVFSGILLSAYKLYQRLRSKHPYGDHAVEDHELEPYLPDS